ncbi:hypothetical protein L1F30_05510 [Simiduia sp. 21SJ11W-1]|uniref:hypothetical protein n=1 Tax=Simiduia sp. 21SJ11W-1 TaxID=2909669 RepID=UPI00209CD215|nr:hypothetical protein [Simiduia sp. 21SJ11W-1]UTA49003.1 hypothetical protein L1F30_05510 [Simiduia sp. 21SJ11W-1]
MAGPDQPKTKAELLRELQSIQSLLDEQGQDAFDAFEDDEDIPILDEFIEDDGPADDDASEPLAADDETLDALNAAYAALTGDIDTGGASAQEYDHEKDTQQAPEPAPKPHAPQQTAARTDAPSHPEETGATGEVAPIDAEPDSDEPEDSHDFSASANHRRDGHLGQHTDPAAPAPLPGQQSLFDRPAEGSPRPAQVTKASGENPFLPQHIRARLRGNQPLPKGEFKRPNTPPAHLEPLPGAESAQIPHEATLSPATVSVPEAPLASAPRPEAPPIDDAAVLALVDALVAEHLPKLEQQLREQLLAKLKQQDPTDH